MTTSSSTSLPYLFATQTTPHELEELCKPFFPESYRQQQQSQHPRHHQQQQQLVPSPQRSPSSCSASAPLLSPGCRVGEVTTALPLLQQQPQLSPPHFQTPRSKGRKNQQKRVVCQVPADGLSSDMWAWHKYGQKPIKGSPYPRKLKMHFRKGSDVTGYGTVSEDDPEYQLIVGCHALSVHIENEIIIIHNFIRDNCRLKFPELESLVDHPIDYARVVKKIGNEMDLTLVDLEALLPSAIIVVVFVTASTTSGKPLPELNLKKTIDACDRALPLDLDKKKVLDFVESRMGYIAPNLSVTKRYCI